MVSIATRAPRKRRPGPSIYEEWRLRTWLSEWEHWRAEADEYLEFGNHVVVLASYRGRGKGSGVEIHQEGAHVFELRDGKVVRLEIFATREKALESVRSARSEETGRVGGGR